MAISVAATNSYTDNTGTVSSHPLNLPSGISSGDLLLVFAAFNGLPTVTDPSGWTVLVSKTNTDTYRIYAKIASGSEGSTVTVALSGANRAASVSYRLTGARSTIDTTATSSATISISSASDANTATPDPPSLTPAWGSAENLWIAATFASDSSFTFSSYPTNYSLGQVNAQGGSQGNGTAVSVASRLLTAATEDPGTFTTVTSRTRSTYTLAIRPSNAVVYTLTAAGGSHTLTGTAATLRRGALVVAGAGAYSLTGSAAVLRRADLLAAGSGSYAVTGSQAGLARQLRVAAGAGSYSLIGTASSFARAWLTAAGAGSYNLTGSAANLMWIRGRRFVLDGGSYGIAGTSASFARVKAVYNDGDVYNVIGTDASLREARIFGAGGESYAISGENAALIRALAQAAGEGAYALTGTPAALIVPRVRVLLANSGAYALAGTAASFLRARRVTALSGGYLIVGKAATPTYDGKGASAAAIRALLGLEPDEVVVVLLTIEHPAIAPIRVTNNNENIVSNGQTFLAYPFNITLPSDTEEPGVAQLDIANVDRSIIEAIELMDDPATCLVQVILASTPNSIEYEWSNLILRNVTADDVSVTAQIGHAPIDAMPYPPIRVTQRDFPGLY